MRIRIRDTFKAVTLLMGAVFIYSAIGLGIGSVALVPVWLFADFINYLSTGVWHTMNGLDFARLIGGGFGAWMESPSNMFGLRDILARAPVFMFAAVAGLISALFLMGVSMVFVGASSIVDHIDEQSKTTVPPA